jgi:stress response protein YsnF
LTGPSPEKRTFSRSARSRRPRRAEQAVVSKQARVKEELVVKKDVDQRTETVSDTVRRTEVKVDDERSSAASKARKRN